MTALQEARALVHYLDGRDLPDHIDAQISLLLRACRKAGREGSFSASHDVEVAARIMRGDRRP